MINVVTLVGRLTADPELRYTPNGVAVANFTLAVNRPFTNQQGEREADFIRIQVWRKLAENVANYVGKGSLVGIVGSLRTRNFEQDGRRVYVTEVLAEQVRFLEYKNGSNNGGNVDGNTNGWGNGSNGHTGQNGAFGSHRQWPDDPFHNDGPIDISDDDLPF
jgi:single-strand DNA-binding protein